MENNRTTEIFIGVLYSVITVMLLLLGFIYIISYLGACITAFVAYSAFQGERVTVKYARLKEGFKIRKDAKNGR